jgi:hypothetical protein
MKIEDISNLETGEIVWAMTLRTGAQLFPRCDFAMSDLEPSRLIFLNSNRDSGVKIELAHKSNGKVITLPPEHLFKTKDECIDYVIGLLENEVEDRTNKINEYLNLK